MQYTITHKRVCCVSNAQEHSISICVMPLAYSVRYFILVRRMSKVDKMLDSYLYLYSKCCIRSHTQTHTRTNTYTYKHLHIHAQTHTHNTHTNTRTGRLTSWQQQIALDKEYKRQPIPCPIASQYRAQQPASTVLCSLLISCQQLANIVPNPVPYSQLIQCTISSQYCA